MIVEVAAKVEEIDVVFERTRLMRLTRPLRLCIDFNDNNFEHLL